MVIFYSSELYNVLKFIFVKDQWMYHKNSQVYLMVPFCTILLSHNASFLCVE